MSSPAGVAASTTSLRNGAVLNISGSNTKQLVHRSIDGGFPSQINWSGGDIELTDSWFGSRGSFTASGQAMMRSADDSGEFSNAGSFHQASGTTTIDVFFNNVGFGEFSVLGTLVLSGGGDNRRIMTVRGTIEFAQELFEFGFAGHLVGDGVVRVTSGRHYLGRPGDAEVGRLEVISSEVDLDGLRVHALTMRDGALVHINNLNAAATVKTSVIDIDGVSRLDLLSPYFIIDYSGATPMPHVAALLRSGYADGSWTGLGISTSVPPGLAIGFSEASELFQTFPATFFDFPVDDSTVLLRLTRYGDANLDGAVNLSDFNRLAGSFGNSGTAWSRGDFNFDSRSNLADFNLLAAQFGQSSGAHASRPVLDQCGPLVLPLNEPALCDEAWRS
jgi:hypothetical protein